MRRATLIATAASTVFTFVLGTSPALCNSEVGRVISISVAENSSNGTVLIPGNFVIDDQGSIRGTIDRMVPFEIVPGEEISFEFLFSNPQDHPVTSDILLQLEFPDGSDQDMYSDELTMDGKESKVFTYETTVPENLDDYGRYTLKLFIDYRLSDFVQFDLHSRSEIEVRWDDGIMVNAWAFYQLCNAWAIRGCLPEGAILDSVGVYILSDGDLYWPWPDDVHQDILLQVFDNDGGGGMPGTLLWSDVTQVTPGTSQAVAFPGIPISSAFYIANDQLTDYPECEGQGVDEACNHPDQMFTRVDDVWENAGSDYNGDFMIWGVGHMNGERFTVGNVPVE